jgi:poly-beta-1,6-N-acetyl-D-glucosamine synthase
VQDLALQDLSGDFRSHKRTVPRPLINFLAVITFLYGIVLTATLPFSIGDALLGDNALRSWGPLGTAWGVFMVLLSSLIMMRWCIIQALAFIAHDRLRRSRSVELEQWPFVSILVPAYNESSTIVSALQSLVLLDYPNYEVIVIDDGSSDDTYAKALPMAGTYPNCTIKVITKPNGGKWSALNKAYHESKGELLLCVDADSRLSADVLKLMVPRIVREQGVVAVSGQVTIRNRENLLTRF